MVRESFLLILSKSAWSPSSGASSVKGVVTDGVMNGDANGSGRTPVESGNSSFGVGVEMSSLSVAMVFSFASIILGTNLGEETLVAE